MATLSEAPSVVVQPLREFHSLWEERATGRDIILHFVFDQYTSPEWVLSELSKQIDVFVENFKKENNATLFNSLTHVANQRKAMETWLQSANFNGGCLKAYARFSLSVDVRRTSFLCTTYELAVYADFDLVHTNVEVNPHSN